MLPEHLVNFDWYKALEDWSKASPQNVNYNQQRSWTISNYSNITVGQTIRVSLRYFALPPPSVEWQQIVKISLTPQEAVYFALKEFNKHN